METIKLNQIGLEIEQTSQTAEKLNRLLGNYQIFYNNVRGLHWNIRGIEFFALHEKFEELYNDASVKIDEIAERILMLGFTPVHTLSSYLENQNLKEVKNVMDSKQAIQSILEGLRELLILQRDILELTDVTNDEGTNSMIGDHIRDNEELVWIYSAALG
ncbi:MAG: Dps family protein [Bacteroidota bacterium]